MNIASSPAAHDTGLQAAHRTVDACFRADVVSGLSRAQKSIPCKYLYDEHGSELFEAICEAPEYYQTRTEIDVLRARAADIASFAGTNVHLIEFGSGANIKARIVLDALKDAASSYVPVDIARTSLLAEAADVARRYPQIAVRPVHADFTKPFHLPEITAKGRRMGFFPGSTIGNLTPADAALFLRNAAKTLGPGGLMVVGVDLKKSRRMLDDAYNDAAGVTAAFNLNLLRRINRELHANFDLDSFTHCAHYNAIHGRIEMHLYSLAFQSVRIDGRVFSFASGESIHTENAYKYSVGDFQTLARANGFSCVTAWTDQRHLFSVHCLAVTT
jgi:L-histidine N-alpha-methyltransferase